LQPGQARHFAHIPGLGRQDWGAMRRESQRRTALRARAERELRLTFGHNLRAERLRRGMSQAELGEECGLAQEYVSAVESGRLNLTIGTMVRIALALEAEVVRLLRRRR
jgi:ribosome-binding protein aMBF1 (putative translation factor)